ncbi:hypothetical protein LJK87_47365 [Paenibacillus sp. P25]|nr:hypothetical protein LJK87_47365 [Paenibacillus sp. P25]
MLSVHWRLAELWTLERQRPLTEEEQSEMSACLHYNAIYARKLAGLYNLSLARRRPAIHSGKHEICERIEKLEGLGSDYPEFKP